MIPPKDGRPRILAVTTDLAITGAKRVLVDGALGVDRRRFDPHVLLLSPTRDDDPLRRELEVGGIPVHHVHVRSRLHVRGLRALARWLAAEARPDVLHTHSARAAAVARLVLWRRRRSADRPRVIVHFHGTVSSRALRPKHRLLDRMLVPCTDLVLAPSAHAAERGCRAHAFQGVPTRVVANGVDLARLATPPRAAADVRAEWGVPADARVVLLLGRWGPAKGQDVVLDALPAILAHPDPVRVVFVAPDGGGAYRTRLERRVAATALRRFVVVAGRATDTPSCYAASDVVVMPSRDEPFGLVAVEAMAAGRPLVVARAGGLPEVCGTEGVLWVEPGDPDGTARAILTALSEGAAARAVRTAALRRRAALFALPRYLAELERAYDDVLAGRTDSERAREGALAGRTLSPRAPRRPRPAYPRPRRRPGWSRGGGAAPQVVEDPCADLGHRFAGPLRPRQSTRQRQGKVTSPGDACPRPGASGEATEPFERSRRLQGTRSFDEIVRFASAARPSDGKVVGFAAVVPGPKSVCSVTEPSQQTKL